MKKLLIILIGASLVFTQLTAQNRPFGKGDKVLNVGVGYGSTWYSGVYYDVHVPPVSASLEFGVANYILEKGSLGFAPYIGYSTFKFEKGIGGYNYTLILAGLRGNFHYPFGGNLDTYASLFLGYNILKSKEFDSPTGFPETGGLRSAFYVGGRYYLAESFAVLVELGYGVTYLNVGLAVKFW